MRVLTATQLTNGAMPGDYHHCVEGELVYMQDPCDMDLRDPDGPCGCGRGFSGMSSHRATSTALVTESDLTRADVREALRSSLEAGGWLDPLYVTAQEGDTLVNEARLNMARVAAHFPTGSVVRRRLSRYFVGSAHT